MMIAPNLLPSLLRLVSGGLILQNRLGEIHPDTIEGCRLVLDGQKRH